MRSRGARNNTRAGAYSEVSLCVVAMERRRVEGAHVGGRVSRAMRPWPHVEERGVVAALESVSGGGEVGWGRPGARRGLVSVLRSRAGSKAPASGSIASGLQYK